MQQFEIILKNDKIKSYSIIALINLLLNFSIFSFLLFYDSWRAVAFTSIIALSLYVLLRWYILKKQNAAHFFDEFVFFIPAMCWFGLRNYLLMVMLIMMGLLYKFSLQKLKFIFTSANVIKNNFPKKNFDWASFSNVILKDNILTLDFKNNKLIQGEIEKMKELDEQQFNEFASRQLDRNSLRPA
ncbi:MAG: hypothetical protein M3Z26_02325 [Bacteroidota bacterium]|nr:hypothetical protein [Bacteroidota bacterium]